MIVPIEQQAVNTFGAYRQIKKTGEEAAELAAAILRYAIAVSREKADEIRAATEAVATEIADVESMCKQMRLVFGDDIIDRATQAQNQKLLQAIQDEREGKNASRYYA